MAELVSIIIPYAPYHSSIVEQAIAAARSQSLPCEVIPVHDELGQGAGWARNEGVALSDSLFVTFLDADDVFTEDAIERMVASYTHNHYVYCDSIEGDSIHQTPDCGVYLNETWHTVSALIPTAAFKAVGGFNETLPALEDTEFFMRLQASGVCGVRCPYPLVRYTAGGRRSREFKSHPSYNATHADIFTKWTGAVQMGCGCGVAVSGVIPDGKVDTDILVTALYSPRSMNGPVTGRLYAPPRGPNNYQLWVDPRDVDARPELWQPIKIIDHNITPAVDDVVRMAAEAMR